MATRIWCASVAGMLLHVRQPGQCAADRRRAERTCTACLCRYLGSAPPGAPPPGKAVCWSTQLGGFVGRVRRDQPRRWYRSRARLLHYSKITGIFQRTYRQVSGMACPRLVPFPACTGVGASSRIFLLILPIPEGKIRDYLIAYNSALLVLYTAGQELQNGPAPCHTGAFGNFSGRQSYSSKPYCSQILHPISPVRPFYPLNL